MKVCVVVIMMSVLCTVGAACYQDARVVTTKVGEISGTVKELQVFGQLRKVNRYFGIPYAEPPVNELRFKKPVPKKSLESPFNATKFGKVCFQMLAIPFPLNKDISFGEDCLTLNVFVPEVVGDSQINLNVMVWIHGGGFVSGASEPYISDTLSAHGNVIVVTMNYRVSIWGFLSTGDEYAPGNYGLWDQHLAIKWVHDNIEDFGGDPQSVTIFGESAGAVSVIYQSLYGGNKGLIQRVIAQSGSITSRWATCKSPKKDAEMFGKLVGCDMTESGKLTKCLRDKSTDLINANLNDFSNGLFRIDTPFIPTIDGEFVKERPYDILLSDSKVSVKDRELFASVDLLMGINMDKGLLMVINPLIGVEDPEHFEPNRTHFENELLPFLLPYELGTVVPKIIKDLIVHEYTDWTEPENIGKRRNKLVALYSDILFGIPLTETVNRHHSLAKNVKNTYMYLFDVLPSQRAIPVPAWAKRANHGDDLPFFFFEESDGFLSYFPWLKDYTATDLDREYSKYLMTMWSNFAKSGDPNRPVPVKMFWPAFTEEKQHYFHMTREVTSDSVKSHFLSREYNLWRKLIPNILNTPGKREESTEYCEKDGECSP